MASETYKYDSVILEQDANIHSYDRSWKIGPHHSSLIANFSTRVAQVTVMETPDFGKVVLIDGEIQSSAADQKFYHQALCRPALTACQGEPKRVLVLGGGELCTIKEVLAWPSVTHVDMVDYDQTFVEFAKRRLKEWHDDSYKDPRVTINIADAWSWTYARKGGELYDSIIIDLTDLSLDADSGEMTHWENLIENCLHLLRPGGSMSMYVGMYIPWKNETMISAYLAVQHLLLSNGRSEVVQPYKVFVPSFASGEAFFLRICEPAALQNPLPLGPPGEWHFGQKEMEHSISFGSDWLSLQ
jgi:spermidine synthase